MLGWDRGEIAASPLLETFCLERSEGPPSQLCFRPTGPKLGPLVQLACSLDAGGHCQKVELTLAANLVSHPALAVSVRTLIFALAREILGSEPFDLGPGEKKTIQGHSVAWVRQAKEHVIRFETRKGFLWWR